MLLVCCVLALTAAGVVHVLGDEHERQGGLCAAIARIKADRIGQWLADRETDARVLAGNGVLGTVYRRARETGDQDSKDHLAARLNELRAPHRFSDILIFSPAGEAECRLGGEPGTVDPCLADAVHAAATGGGPVRIGPYRDTGGLLRLDIAVALAAVGPPPVAVLRIDPHDWLLPALHSWPLPRPGARSLLLLPRDGGLAYVDGRPAAGDPELAALPRLDGHSLAERGARGEIPPGEAVFGVDHQGVPVLGLVLPVPGTDWMLTAAIALAELRAAAAEDLVWVGVAGALTLIIALTGLRLVRQRAELARARLREQDQAGRLRSLGLLAAVADSSDDVVFAKDLEGGFLLFNRAAERLLGRPARELIGLTERDFLPPEVAERVLRDDRWVMEHGVNRTLEERMPTAEGERDFLTTKGPLRDSGGRVIGMFAVARDITDSKRAEAELRASEAFARAILDAVPATIAVVDRDGRIIAVNAPWRRFVLNDEADSGTRLPHTDLGTNYLAVCDRCEGACTEGAREAAAGIRAVLAGGAPRFVLEYPCHSPARQRWFSMMVTPYFNRDGLGGAVISHVEVTERVVSAATLKRLADDLSATLAAIPDPFFEIDAEGRYLQVRAQRPELLAAPAEDLLGRTVDEVLPADAAGAFRAALAAAAAGNGGDYGRTFRLPVKGGHRWFELSVARKSGGGEGPARFIVLSRDITVRKAAQDALRRRGEELALRNEELERFNRAMVGRELDMIRLKHEVNGLCRELGREPVYPLEFLQGAEGGTG